MNDNDRAMITQTREELARIKDMLDRALAIAEARRQASEPSPAAVIARYNRAHGQNKKITLKQICEDMGVSYSRIRQYKSRERKRKSKK